MVRTQEELQQMRVWYEIGAREMRLKIARKFHTNGFVKNAEFIMGVPLPQSQAERLNTGEPHDSKLSELPSLPDAVSDSGAGTHSEKPAMHSAAPKSAGGSRSHGRSEWAAGYQYSDAHALADRDAKR